jgi:hypothetical protein
MEGKKAGAGTEQLTGRAGGAGFEQAGRFRVEGAQVPGHGGKGKSLTNPRCSKVGALASFQPTDALGIPSKTTNYDPREVRHGFARYLRFDAFRMRIFARGDSPEIFLCVLAICSRIFDAWL